MAALGAGKSRAVAGSIVPQTGQVLKSATPAPAFNPPDPNHGHRRRAVGALALSRGRGAAHKPSLPTAPHAYVSAAENSP